VRPEGFDFSAQIFRKQILEFGIQHVGQDKKLQVWDTAFSIFQSGKGALTGVPTCQLQFHRKLILIPAFLFTEFANLRPDHIQRNCRRFFDAGSVSAGKFVFSPLLHIYPCAIAPLLEIFWQPPESAWHISVKDENPKHQAGRSEKRM
jgi:hypothetical protein